MITPGSICTYSGEHMSSKSFNVPLFIRPFMTHIYSAE